MATYASLTTEQQAILTAWDRDFRGWVNALATLLIQARVLDDSYNTAGGAGEILALLTAGEIVPNTGGIAGAQSLATTDYTPLVGGLGAFLTSYDTDTVRQLIAKSSGPTAGL